MILCMNAATGGITEWDLDWLGVAEHEGVIYGIISDSLISLDHDGTETIDGIVRTGELDFGTAKEKNIPRAHFEIKQQDSCFFTTYASRGGSSVSRSYPLPVRSFDGTDDGLLRKEQLARGIRGPWWSFELSGAEWEMGGLYVRVEPISFKG